MHTELRLLVRVVPLRSHKPSILPETFIYDQDCLRRVKCSPAHRLATVGHNCTGNACSRSPHDARQSGIRAYPTKRLINPLSSIQIQPYSRALRVDVGDRFFWAANIMSLLSSAQYERPHFLKPSLAPHISSKRISLPASLGLHFFNVCSTTGTHC